MKHVVPIKTGLGNLPKAFQEVARLANEAGLAGHRVKDADFGIISAVWVGGAPSFHERVAVVFLSYEPVEVTEGSCPAKTK